MKDIKSFFHKFVKVHIILKARKTGIHNSSSCKNQCVIHFSLAILHMGLEAKGKAYSPGHPQKKISYVMALFT